MADPINSDNDIDPFKHMRDVVRDFPESTRPAMQAERVTQAPATIRDPSVGRDRIGSASVAPPTSPTLAQVLQAYDEILKRLESAKLQSDEMRQAMTRATLPNGHKQGPIDHVEGTIFDQLAARAVMISRVAEEIEHNLALSLSAMR